MDAINWTVSLVGTYFVILILNIDFILPSVMGHAVLYLAH